MSSPRKGGFGSYATSNSAYGEVTDRFGRSTSRPMLGKLADIHEGRKRHRSVGDRASDFSQQAPLLGFNARRKSIHFGAGDTPPQQPQQQLQHQQHQHQQNHATPQQHPSNGIHVRSSLSSARRRRHSYTGADSLAPLQTNRGSVPRLNLPDAAKDRYKEGTHRLQNHNNSHPPLSNNTNTNTNNHKNSFNNKNSGIDVSIEEQDDVFLPQPKLSWTSGSQRPRTSHGKKPQYGVASEAGEKGRKRKTNQDGFLMIQSPGKQNQNDFVAGVFDGHGRDGHCVSNFIKERLGTRMQEAHRHFRPTSAEHSDVSKRMQDAFLDVETDLGKVKFDATNSGSTAVICARKGNKLIVGHVGDSRAVLGRRGAALNDDAQLEAVALTVDHTLQNLEEIKRATAAGGQVEPIYVHGQGMMGPPRLWKKKQQEGGLAVSRAFGDMSLKGAGCSAVPEVHVKTISDKDKFVILASDGVWDHVSNQQAVDIAQKYSDPRKASDEIVKLARGRWKQTDDSYVDDITALVTNL